MPCTEGCLAANDCAAHRRVARSTAGLGRKEGGHRRPASQPSRDSCNGSLARASLLPGPLGTFRNLQWRLSRLVGRGREPFTCNVCGYLAPLFEERLDRETPSCTRCRSTVRMRTIVHALSTELFGESLTLRQFPHRKDLVGIGMSDWSGYATELARRLSYTNCFYDREPRLDITNPPASLTGTLDFLISTDVFEHVAPPVVTAFENARRLLKPTGVFIFSVPYTASGETTEHFPDLHDFRLDTTGPTPRLINRTIEGETQTFEDLVFHGGSGLTLEMRTFSEPSLRKVIHAAGFAPPVVYKDPVPRFGIRWEEPLSVPMALR